MKVLQIAAKDLRRSLRSAFLIAVSVAVPLLITGLLYFAFGGLIDGEAKGAISPIKVIVVNLDLPDPTTGFAGGRMMTQHLVSPEMNSHLDVAEVTDAAEARAGVDAGRAAVAVIIPEGFTKAVLGKNARAEVELYEDPASTLGPMVVQAVMDDFVDGFAGAKIAAEVVARQSASAGKPLSQEQTLEIAARYASWLDERSHEASAVVTRSPAEETKQGNSVSDFFGPVMAGMMVFFMFFTGAAAAQAILTEDEEGTLARLFTTPTAQSTILGGKFLAVALTVGVQAVVLVAASALLFRIRWGSPLAVVAVLAPAVFAASGFGVMLMSFLKSTRQAGAATGFVVTITGVLGGLIPTGDPAAKSPFEMIGSVFPQAWAFRGLKLAIAGGDVLLPMLILVGFGVVLFVVGALAFRRRFR